MIKIFQTGFFCLFLCFTTNAYCQQLDMMFLLVPDNMKEKSNSIILDQKIDVEIISQNKYTQKTSKTIMILNELGAKNINAVEFYSKNNIVNSIGATVYSASGKKIKSYRKSDFIDQSMSDGFSIIGDYRSLFLKITPSEYPFIVVFESETSSSNTVFLPQWHPIDDVHESVIKSIFTLKFPSNLGFKFKTSNFENYDIAKIETPNSLSLELKNAAAFQTEDFSPNYRTLIPETVFSLEKFSLEGVEGEAKNWAEFGDWMSRSLLIGLDELPQETISKMKTLVVNEKDPIAKAKIIYKYVQEKVRYVSIQLGIGGWKPMAAKDVDRLGYGDCKALTNYTKALLKAVDVTSYYSIIFGGNPKQNMDADFFRMQGNHVVLALPVNDEYQFLECTSQTSPFGYQGNFTDDRDAFVVLPVNSKMVHTKKFDDIESTQETSGECIIDANGRIEAAVTLVSKGIQFENVDDIILKTNTEILEHYKERFSYINNIVFQKPILKTDKNIIVATETLNFVADAFAQQTGNQLFFAPNIFSQAHRMPQRYRNRKNPFEIQHGFTDTDTVLIKIPSGFSIDAMTEKLEVTEKFGSYKMTCEKTASNDILYKRSYRLNTNRYEKSDYENFRKFIEKIAQFDGAKIVLKKI